MDYSLEPIKEWAHTLPIIQYRGAKKNQQLLDLIVELIFAKNLLLQIRDNCLSVENSIGVQLDIVGAWVGIDRYYDGIDLWDSNKTSLVNYSNIDDDSYPQWTGGFSNYSDFESQNGGFLTYKLWQDTRTKVNAMGDAFFRKLIKLKIIKNSISFTNKNIDNAIFEWSSGEIYTTWGTMEVTYHYPSSLTDLINLAVYKNVLLAPTGVKIILDEY